MKKLLLVLFCCFFTQQLDSQKPKDSSGYSVYVTVFAAAVVGGWLARSCFVQYRKNLEERVDQKPQKSKGKRVPVFGGPLGHLFGKVEAS